MECGGAWSEGPRQDKRPISSENDSIVQSSTMVYSKKRSPRKFKSQGETARETKDDDGAKRKNERQRRAAMVRRKGTTGGEEAENRNQMPV